MEGGGKAAGAKLIEGQQKLPKKDGGPNRKGIAGRGKETHGGDHGIFPALAIRATRDTDGDLVGEPGKEDEDLMAGQGKVFGMQRADICEPGPDVRRTQHGPGPNSSAQDGDCFQVGVR